MVDGPLAGRGWTAPPRSPAPRPGSLRCRPAGSSGPVWGPPEAGQPAAEVGDRSVGVERAEFLKDGDTVVDTAALGRIRNRKSATSPSRSAAICRITAARLVRRISGSVYRGRLEVLLRYSRMQTPVRCVPSSRHAGRRRPGRPVRWEAAGPWSACCSGRFERCRVDHVADARHRQRRLGDVGGQHHPPDQAAGVRHEHLVLFGRGQPRVQRQYFDVSAPCRYAPRIASAVSRISRSPERNTSTSPGGSLESSCSASMIASVSSRGSTRTTSWSGSSAESSDATAERGGGEQAKESHRRRLPLTRRRQFQGRERISTGITAAGHRTIGAGPPAPPKCAAKRSARWWPR